LTVKAVLSAALSNAKYFALLSALAALGGRLQLAGAGKILHQPRHQGGENILNVRLKRQFSDQATTVRR